MAHRVGVWLIWQILLVQNLGLMYNTGMTEILIVDGYNIIHAIPEIENKLDRNLMSARSALEAALRKYQLNEKSIREIYIVYDGNGFSGRDVEDMGLVKNIYTSKDSDADNEIVNILKNMKKLNKTMVFSRDNFVINHARAMGADVLSINSFRKKMAGKSGPSRAAELSEGEKAIINRELKAKWGIE
jgi:predicted RNA-binding protein with PIN domain